MTEIKVYDLEVETLTQWANEYDVTIAELVEAIVDAIKAGEIKLEDYL